MFQDLRFRIQVSRFKFQASSFKIQVSSRQLPDISLCLEGSTERSNGIPGRTLGKTAMEVRDTATGNR